jgi:hypothetical protein
MGKSQKRITVNNENYFIPTMAQYQSIFPVRWTYSKTLAELSGNEATNNFCLNKPGSVSINEFMNITQGINSEDIRRVNADYKTGTYRTYKAMYAIKKKRATEAQNGIEPYTSDKYRCAYLYFFEKINNNQDWVLRVRMKYLGEFSPYTIDDIATTDFWDDGTKYFFTKSFCCKPYNSETASWYWSTTYHEDGSGSTTVGQEMLCIDPENGYVGIFDRKTPSSMSAMIRLFKE